MLKCLKNGPIIKTKFSLLQTGHKQFIRLTKQKQKYNRVHEMQKNILQLCMLYVIYLFFYVKILFSIPVYAEAAMYK